MIDGFWVKIPDYGRSRESDPLALSSIHDAAADVLLPYISGRTNKAEDYLWVLIGLRWSEKNASTESDIWERFENFEKALKLNWTTKAEGLVITEYKRLASNTKITVWILISNCFLTRDLRDFLGHT